MSSLTIERPEDYEICEFDGVGAATVYYGGLTELEKANGKLLWRYDVDRSKAWFDPYKVLTLSEIAEQSRKNGYQGLITIFTEYPLRGDILQYGYPDEEWCKIGSTLGYA